MLPSERLGVGYLAVADEARGEVETRAAHHPAVVDLGRCEVAPVDVQTDGATL